jgi:hypothetical protein
MNIGKTKHTIQVTADIINVGNLINRNWGLYQDAFTGASSGGVSILSYKGFDTTTGKPMYSFPYLDKNNSIPVTKSFIYDTGQISRYQAQIGIRYIFN